MVIENGTTSLKPNRKRGPDDLTNLPQVLNKEKRSRVDCQFNAAADANSQGVKQEIVTEVAGRIASLEIENFMCHGNIFIPFDVKNNNCFYIGGPNGSGKSAVFAAFNLGLGGRGNMNDRGNNVKSYIKTGKQKAKIRIGLTNRGQGAINKLAHQELGDTIYIERVITQSSTTYAIKSSSGAGSFRRERLITNKKSDLDLILNRFNIQLANPVFWMSQDRSRQFLQSWDPAKMFIMFMEATGLQKAWNTYTELLAIMDDIKKNEKVVESQQAEKKREFSGLLDARSEYQKLKKKRNELSALDWVRCWASLRDARVAIRSKTTEIDTCTKVVTELKEALHTMESNKDENHATNNNLAEETDKYLVLSKGIQKELNENENTENEINLRRREFSNKIQKNQQLLRVHQQKIESMESAINAKRSKDTFSQLQQLKQELSHATRERQELAEKRARASNEMKEIEQNRKQKELIVEEVSNSERKLRSQLGQQTKYLSECEAYAKDHLSRFGAKTPQILNLLDRNKHLFRKLPKGPLGRYVTVKDKKWSFAIEEFTRGSLQAYIVDNAEDQKTFKRLLSDNGIYIPTMLRQKFGLPLHNIRRNEPSEEFATIYRLISVSDSDVLNTLIDNTGMESVLLLGSDEETRRTMYGQAPQNAVKAVSVSGGQAFAHPYRFYACQRTRSLGMLDSNTNINPDDIRKEIESIKSQLDNLQAQRRSAESDLYKVKTSFDQSSNILNKMEAEISSNGQKSMMLSNKISKLENEQESDEVDSLRASIEQYRIYMEKCQEEIEDLQQSLARCTGEMDSNRISKAGLEEKKNKINKELTSIQEMMKTQREKEDRYNIEHSKLVNRKEIAMEKLQSLEDELVVLHKEEKIAIENTKEADHIPVPENFTNPPDLDMIPSFLQVTKIDEQLRMEVRKQERICENLTTTADQVSEDRFKVYHREFISFKAQTKMLRQLKRKLQNSLDIRLENFPIIRRTLTQRLKTTFTDLMFYLKFNGILDVNTETCKLNIKVSRVKSDKDQQQPALQDMKGLSGGERSYTTACLVMALWGTMDHPFRLLDEFDVFMDMINRKIVMDMLVELATKKYPQNQFIFFTPQGIKELGDKERVDIFTMPTPRDN